MKRYNRAKDLYDAQQYPQAFQAFKELSEPHKNNVFETHARFYTALSAYQQENYPIAEVLFKQFVQKYPDWKQKDEAVYFLTEIAFLEKNYGEAFSYLKQIENEDTKADALNMKKYFVQQIDSIAILKKYEQELKDKDIAETLAKRLDKRYNTIENKLLLEYLIQDYGLNRENYPYGTFRKNEKKHEYNIAILLPFMNNIEKGYRKSARFYELYEGIKLATDSLLHRGIIINLYAYDTQKDTSRVHEILNHKEMQEMDLFIGPVYPKTSAIMKQFATINQINYVNPLQNDGNLIYETDYVYLSKSSCEVKGKNFAEFANYSFPKRDVVVFYGGKEKDSVLASSYIAHLDSVDKRVVCFKEITKRNVKDIRNILNNVDDKNLSHIFVSSSEKLVGATLMSAIEGNNIMAPVIAPSKWLEIEVLEYEQFRRHQFHFDYDDYHYLLDTNVAKFRNAFQERMSLKPGIYSKKTDAYYGYETMFFFGQMLYKHGHLFNEAIKNEEDYKGLIKMHYHRTNANNISPLLRFNEYYELEWVNFPHYQEGSTYEKDRD
ncbi:MAG: outer membrane protein assembly factor BamD [Cytophagales bacterium]|nr:outer membrane protein assembly factor BamD [Cytophagales bacterium]